MYARDVMQEKFGEVTEAGVGHDDVLGYLKRKYKDLTLRTRRLEGVFQMYKHIDSYSLEEQVAIRRELNVGLGGEDENNINSNTNIVEVGQQRMKKNASSFGSNMNMHELEEEEEVQEVP